MDDFEPADLRDQTSVTCAECGATVSDWPVEGPNSHRPGTANQEKHKAWHERLKKETQMSALGFPAGFF